MSSHESGHRVEELLNPQDSRLLLVLLRRRHRLPSTALGLLGELGQLGAFANLARLRQGGRCELAAWTRSATTRRARWNQMLPRVSVGEHYLRAFGDPAINMDLLNVDVL